MMKRFNAVALIFAGAAFPKKRRTPSPMTAQQELC
jgi:hypothetical protein